MLLEMRVENFILIDKLTLEFHKGLNIFTGETGAGKSMIIGALTVGLGGKTSAASIRSGAEKAFIQLVFDIENVVPFKALDIDIEDGLLIISRELLKNNRSIIRINDRAATMTTLSEVSKLLMDIHGQHAHQTLLYPKNHLQYLDLLGDHKHQELLELVKADYLDIKELQNQMKEIETMDLHHLDEDYIRYQLKEIESVNLTSDDENSLEKKYDYYKNIEAIYTNIQNTIQILAGDHESNGLKEMLTVASKQVSEVEAFDDKLSDFSNRFDEMTFELDDISTELRHYVENLDIDEREMHDVEIRMNAVSALKVKYGKTIQDILFKKQQLSDQLELITDKDEKLDKIQKLLKEAQKKYLKDAKSLSEDRLKLKTRFEKTVERELTDLNMQDCDFEISFKLLEKNEYRLSPTGLDVIEFMISTNIGIEKAPLSKIASGGEISRIMLAIKLALSNHDYINSLVFDEVDTGISGNTAIVVGEKIHTITNNYQVICITHLPQIAAMSDKHFLLKKQVQNAITTTVVEHIEAEDIHKELARMLSGYDDSQLSINAAKELLTLSRAFKEAL